MPKLLFLLLLVCPIFLNAQTEKEIRDHYQETNKKIADSKDQGMEGPLYCNEWTTNKNSRSWPAVGLFQESTSFWYDDDPNHISSKERDPKTVLLKVNVTRRSSHLITNEEYLYKNGRLVFFYSNEAEEGREWETRVWFNTKGMFKSIVKADGKELSAKDLATDDYKDFKPKPIQILKYGKKYQDLFVKDMVYE